MKKTRKLLVASARNSQCGSANVNKLDWSRWFTDNSCNMHYLHVAGEDDSWHSVTCCFSEQPRLGFESGKLYWLVDE